MRAHDDSEDIYDKLISELVRYMETNQGGFYLVQEEEMRQNLEGARRELRFLSNVPPISGILRALDHIIYEKQNFKLLISHLELN